MTSAETMREQALLASLRRHFEEGGYAFFERPARELIPAFLGSYAPDAIAYDKGGGGVVIEVKSRPTATPSDQLPRIAKLFEHQKAWRFHVVYGSGDTDLDADLEPPAIGSIRTALSELDALEAGKHFRAGFLFAWSVLESAGRLLDPGARGAMAPRQMIERLTSEGFLSQAISAKLRVLLPLRHAVAHGDLSLIIGRPELDTMKAAIGEVLDRARPLAA